MSKLSVWKYVKATDIIDRYQDADENIPHVTVVDSFPKAKKEALVFLNNLIKDVENLKLRDLE